MSDILFTKYPERGGIEKDVYVQHIFDTAKDYLNEIWRDELQNGIRTNILDQESRAYAEHLIKENNLDPEKLDYAINMRFPNVAMSKYISDETYTIQEIAKAHLENEGVTEPSDELIEKHVKRITNINQLTSNRMNDGKPHNGIVIILPNFCIKDEGDSLRQIQ